MQVSHSVSHGEHLCHGEMSYFWFIYGQFHFLLSSSNFSQTVLLVSQYKASPCVSRVSVPYKSSRVGSASNVALQALANCLSIRKSLLPSMIKIRVQCLKS